MSAPDKLPIAVRAFTERGTPRPRRQSRTSEDQPSEWALIFDTETTIDSAQQLRFGVYQVRKGDRLAESGVFYDPTLSEPQRRTLQAFAQTHGLRCRSLAEFVEKVFFRIAYDQRGTIVGFNLPFDLSRIAIDHGPARGSMRGGFSFRLSPFETRPRVRVKHLSRTMSLIDLAAPGKNESGHASLRRGLKTAAHRGYFVDVATVAAALLSERFTLARLCERLQTTARKLADAEHGAELAEAYITYACVDVQVTWECFVALREQYAGHVVSTPLHRILSEASLGKAYLRDMNVEPFLGKQPDFPRKLLGAIMSGYYGGRAEVRWRRTIQRVLYCDFKSMYPTVNALMGLWGFVIAEELRWRDDTEQARCFLAKVSAEMLTEPATWRELAVMVRVRPNHDLFPVRAKYCDGPMHTIGLNYLSCGSDLWVTMADCAAAKLLSGKEPQILEAIRFEPSEPQAGLKPIDLFGNPDYRVDPATEDVFVRLVDLRDEAKAKRNPIQQAIKIIVNATSYGIFIEVQRDDLAAPESVAVYGPTGGRRLLQTKALEQPGKFFHPLLGVLITGAARLMLALAERKVLDAGLDWAFCDTDSIAIVKPDELSEEEFIKRAGSVVDWFETLNPYKKLGSILKIEDANYEPGTSESAPLFCFAISAKRYALFNVDRVGRPIIRKASAHGLGHFLAPYPEGDAPKSIPAPAVPLSEIGVERWQYDLWFKIIEAALGEEPRNVTLNYHPSLAQPALTRFGVSSPALERWMKSWNATRPYAERVRPFGFMTAFQPRTAQQGPEAATLAEATRRGRPPRRTEIKPIAPFNRDPAGAVANAFDRESCKPILANQLKTYAEALAQYHLHPEDKFLNGDYWDSGRTERRHVVAVGVRLIGKEANKWEEQSITGQSEDALDLGTAHPRARRLSAS